MLYGVGYVLWRAGEKDSEWSIKSGSEVIVRIAGEVRMGKKIHQKSREVRFNRLQLEYLETRTLLSTVIEGVDLDGDGYEIKLIGPGNVTDSSLDNLTVAGTTMSSKLIVSVTNVIGDGLVNIKQVSTGAANLGRLKVQGDLGGLIVGRLGQLHVQSFGAAVGTIDTYSMGGDVGTINVPGGIRDATVLIGGKLGVLQVGNREDGSSNISNSSFNLIGDVTKIQLRQSLTAGSLINVNGAIGKFDIDKSIVNGTVQASGDVANFWVDGGIRSTSTIEIEGDLQQMKVKKTVSDTDITVEGKLQSAKIGGDLRNATLLTNAIDQLLIGDDLEDTQIGVTDDLLKLQTEDSRNLTLRVSGRLHKLQVKRDLDGGLISALNGIGVMKVGQDLNRSTIVAGIDIGADFALDVAPGGDDTEWGNVVIEKIQVKGDMIDSSIASGVRSEGIYFGDGNDVPTADDIGTARIYQVIVKGEISSTNLPGESFAISAADGIDLIRSGRHLFTGAAGVAVQQF